MDRVSWAFCVHVGEGGVGLWEKRESLKLSECSCTARSPKQATQERNGLQDGELAISKSVNPFPTLCSIYLSKWRETCAFSLLPPWFLFVFLLYHLHEIERILKVNSFPFRLAWTIVWIGFSPRRAIVILYLAEVPAAHIASRLSSVCVHLDALYFSKYLVWGSQKNAWGKIWIHEICFMGDGVD